MTPGGIDQVQVWGIQTDGSARLRTYLYGVQTDGNAQLRTYLYGVQTDGNAQLRTYLYGVNYGFFHDSFGVIQSYYIIPANVWIATKYIL